MARHRHNSRQRLVFAARICRNLTPNTVSMWATSIPKNRRLCQAGLVLQGLLKPNECPAFGKECTPEHPLGATMVSGEGACAAYYRYKREL